MNKYIAFAGVLTIILGVSLYPHKGSIKPSKLTLEVKAQNVPIRKGNVYPVNTHESNIYWSGTKLFRTAGHEGIVKIKEGMLLFDKSSLTGGVIIVDMNTISITDTTSYSRSTMDRLSLHLKKAEFNTENYPIAKFEITDVTYLSGDSLRVAGEMAIRDVIKKITVPASIKYSTEDYKHFYTEFSLDRYDWNIGDDASLLERNLVDREFNLRIELVASRVKVKKAT